MGMKLDEAIKRYNSNAFYEKTDGNLQGYLEFKQLAKWLEELRAYRNMYHADNVDNCLREKAEDCISRRAALNTIDKMLNANCSTSKEYHDLLVACFNELIAVTPKSNKPIIYCKDCRHNGSFDTDCPIRWDKKDNDFCSFAER